MAAAHEALVQLFREEKVKPVVYERRFSLQDLLLAFEALRSREAYGKVVLTTG